MKDRIQNILLETLIFESPLFRAIAIKADGKVYEGEPFMIHAELLRAIFPTDHIDPLKPHDVIHGYVTTDGRFVNRKEASRMVRYEDSEAMRKRGELVEDEN